MPSGNEEAAGNAIQHSHLVSFPESGSSGLKAAANYLEDQTKIYNFFDTPDKYRRYVDINLQNIFDALVSHYTMLFETFYEKLNRLIGQFAIEGEFNGLPMKWAATCYVSSFIHDLYVMNRESVRKLADAAFIERYMHELTPTSYEYDPFLTQLGACLRPTNIKMTHEDALFIPVLNATPNWESAEENFFRLNHFAFNRTAVYGIIQILRDRKLMKFHPLPENVMGRPFWLFDRQADANFYAWFPPQANYDMQDVTLAYILGCACSPRLAPRDIDDWQLFEGNVIPANVNANDYDRSRALVYRGRVEYTTIETQSMRYPAALRQLQRHAIAVGPNEYQFRGDTPNGLLRPSRRRRRETDQGALAVRTREDDDVRDDATSETSVRTRLSSRREEAAAAVPGQSDQPDAEATAVGQPRPPPPPEVNYASIYSEIRRYRLITYLYYHVVTRRIDSPSKFAAFTKIVRSGLERKD